MKTRVVMALLCLLPAAFLVLRQDSSRAEVTDDACGAVQLVVEMFELLERQEWQEPERVLELIGFQPGNRVVDLGAGTGDFTRLLSTAVGKDGTAYAVDTSQAMLDFTARTKNGEHVMRAL